MDKDEAHKQEPVRAWFTADEFVEMAERRTKEWAKQADIPDLIAGALGVSRGTAYDLMRDALAERYVGKNPLGGPAKVFDAMADSIRAGDEYHAVLRQYGFAEIAAAQPAPVQEPFCFVYVENGEEYFAPKGAYVPDNAQPLYTTPPAQPAPVQSLPFGVGGGLVAIKTLLSRDPCVHANTAIEMLDAILKEHPAAQPAPVQEPVAWPCVIAEADFEKNTVTLEMQCSDYKVGAGRHWLHTTPPAAQRQWVGLTEQEAAECWSTSTVRTWQAIEAKLKEKNT